jgi:hypothetical protein
MSFFEQKPDMQKPDAAKTRCCNNPMLQKPDAAKTWELPGCSGRLSNCMYAHAAALLQQQVLKLQSL